MQKKRADFYSVYNNYGHYNKKASNPLGLLAEYIRLLFYYLTRTLEATLPCFLMKRPFSGLATFTPWRL